MGCGQSKINLYPRRNKNGGKGSSSKKSGAADKETDDDESTECTVPPEEQQEEYSDHGRSILPLSVHPSTCQVSASQQDFFKMLDDKIEKGKDYDSSSETEMRIEHERRKSLIQQWRAASLSSQSHSSQSHSSPPTPARRRVNRPMPQSTERQSSPASGRRCYRQQHVPDGMSPPPRRSHSAQSHHHTDSRQINGDNWNDSTKSPVKRPQSAGANWKSNPKVAPYNQKPKKNEIHDNHKALNEADGSSNQDVSQVTFNPTFQSDSPAHSAKPQQPYIAQIISYPLTQQVPPPSPPKVIAPPEEYQDPDNNVTDNCSKKQIEPNKPNTQPQIFYMHGNTATVTHDLTQQRQQTAIHLQQYVAMKQAQQQMYTYFQRSPHSVFPSVDFTQTPGRVHEGDEYQYVHPAMRPHSAPTPVGVVRPMPVVPGFNPMPDGTHMVPMPMWPHMPPVVSTMGPWSGQVPPEMQYYPQSQFIPMYRSNSAGSAGTLTRYKKESSDVEAKNVCQSINLVRQKPIGQIVSMPGQELTVCNSTSDSPSPASVSTDSGVSPGSASAPSSKSSVTPPAPSPALTPPRLPAPPVIKTKRIKPPSLNVRSRNTSKSLDLSGNL